MKWLIQFHFQNSLMYKTKYILIQFRHENIWIININETVTARFWFIMSVIRTSW